MKKSLVNLLKRIHSKSPLWLSGLYMPMVYFLRHLQTFYLHSYQLEGEERESGATTRITYFGRDEKIRNYWKKTLFKTPPKEKRGPGKFLGNISTSAKHNVRKDDLILVELTRLTRMFFNKKRGFVLPRWFDTLLDPELTLESLGKNDTLRQIKKFGFSMEVRNREEDLRFFYDRMFTPYILERHGDASVLVEYSYFQKKLKKKDSRLYFLLMDGEPVVASLNERIKGRIKFSGIGVLDGSLEIIRKGAIRALYHFMLSDYHNEGEKEISFGGTSPLLSDGLTQFKISMRAFPDSKDLLGEKSLWLLPLTDTPALRNLLMSNPFLHIRNRRVYRSIFLDPVKIETVKAFRKTLKKTHYRRIDGTTVYCFEDPGKIPEWIGELKLQDHESLIFDLEYP